MSVLDQYTQLEKTIEECLQSITKEEKVQAKLTARIKNLHRLKKESEDTVKSIHQKIEGLKFVLTLKSIPTQLWELRAKRLALLEELHTNPDELTVKRVRELKELVGLTLADMPNHCVHPCALYQRHYERYWDYDAPDTTAAAQCVFCGKEWHERSKSDVESWGFTRQILESYNTPKWKSLWEHYMAMPKEALLAAIIKGVL